MAFPFFPRRHIRQTGVSPRIDQGGGGGGRQTHEGKFKVCLLPPPLFLLLRLPRTRLTEWPMHQVFFLLLLLEYYAWKKADRLYFEGGKIKVGHWPRNEKSFFRYYAFPFRQTQGKQCGRRWHFGAFLPSVFVNRRVGLNSVTDLISCVDVWMAIVIRPLVLCAFLLDRFQASADRTKQKSNFFFSPWAWEVPRGALRKGRKGFLKYRFPTLLFKNCFFAVFLQK